MQPNATGFRWSKRSERAAVLVADDAQTDEAIARECGIHKVTLERWKLNPEFAARVSQRVAELAAAVLDEGIRNRQNRVAAQNDRWNRMQTLIAERAALYEDVPGGGSTGLIVRQVKVSRYGEVEEFVFDAALVRELRAHEEQAAKELGQWTEKHDHSGSVLIRQYGGFDPDDI